VQGQRKEDESIETGEIRNQINSEKSQWKRVRAISIGKALDRIEEMVENLRKDSDKSWAIWYVVKKSCFVSCKKKTALKSSESL
jgi:hypothetical protein